METKPKSACQPSADQPSADQPRTDRPQSVELRSSKRALRLNMSALAAAFPMPERAAESGAVAAAILKSAAWRAARTVFLYAALPVEVSTELLFEAALAARKTIGFPTIAGGELLFRQVRSSDGPWEFGPFGIREPVPSLGAVDPALCAGPVLVVAPGAAFDLTGGRLGRGKGYYDRFLRRLRAARTDVQAVGAAFSFQIVDRVPADDGDAAMDAVAVTTAETAGGAGELLSARRIDIFNA